MTAAIEKRAKLIDIPWWVILIQGLASVFLGCVFLFSPGVTFFVVVQLLGIYWLVSGFLALVRLLFNRFQWGWKLVSGILGITGGLIVLAYPLLATVVTASAVVIILAVEGIILGVIGIVQAFQGEGWGSIILGGLSIILGILILANLWVVAFSLPLVIGVVAVVGGIISIIAAFRMRT